MQARNPQDSELDKGIRKKKKKDKRHHRHREKEEKRSSGKIPEENYIKEEKPEPIPTAISSQPKLVLKFRLGAPPPPEENHVNNVREELNHREVKNSKETPETPESERRKRKKERKAEKESRKEKKLRKRTESLDEKEPPKLIPKLKIKIGGDREHSSVATRSETPKISRSNNKMVSVEEKIPNNVCQTQVPVQALTPPPTNSPTETLSTDQMPSTVYSPGLTPTNIEMRPRVQFSPCSGEFL